MMSMSANIFPSIVSPFWVEQYRTILHHQRKGYETERGLWELERNRLIHQIRELEASLQRLQAENMDKHSGASKTAFFSPSHSPKVEEQPPNSTEGVQKEKSKAPFVMGTGISVPVKSMDLDGINFKENIRAPPIAESFMAAPRRVLLPSPIFECERLRFTGGAGHTPLKTQLQTNLDSNAMSSGFATPIQEDHGKLPSLEQCPSVAEDSLEQPDQDAPRMDPDPHGGDRQLKWPLGLANDQSGDESFLHQLDYKLIQVEKSKTDEVPEPARPENDGSSGEPEDMEDIQLKPALNFGTPFGSAHCGKNI